LSNLPIANTLLPQIVAQPFFGNVTNNIMALVKGLGDAGLVGLITLGIILWLFSGREVA